MCVGEGALRGVFKKVTMTDTDNLEMRLGNPRISIFRILALKAKLMSLKLSSEQAPSLSRKNIVLRCNVQKRCVQIYYRKNNQITAVLQPIFLQ